MLSYEEYRNKRQAEFNALPIFYAFSDSQLEEELNERGLDINSKSDLEKIMRIGRAAFAMKKDKEVIHEYLNKSDELPELMKNAKFAENAFYYEMGNHEYHINMQADWDVCSCFGHVEYTEDDNELEQYFDQLGFEKQTRAAFFSARKKYMKACEENGWF